MQHDEDYWTGLTALSVSENGFYWFRQDKKEKPEIVEVRGLFDNATKKLRFLDADDDSYAFSLQVCLKNWPEAQVSAEQIKPPKD